jgi:hypothetical protein
MSGAASDLESSVKTAPRSPWHWAWKVLLFLVMIGGAFALAWFYDEPPPDDTDLLVTFPSFPENDPDNGFLLLSEAGELTDVWPNENPAFTDEILETIFENPSQMDLAKAKELMALNESAWAAYQQVWVKPRFYNPKPLGDAFRWGRALMSYSRLGYLRANILFKEGRTDEALLELEQLADNLSKSREPEGRELMVAFLTNLATSRLVRQTLQENCQNLATKKQCLHAMRILDKSENAMSASRFKMVLRMEYMFIREKMENNGEKLMEELREMKKNGWIKDIPTRFSVKPNALLREHAELLRGRLADYSSDVYVPYSAPPPPKSSIPYFIREWFFGKWLEIEKEPEWRGWFKAENTAYGSAWSLTIKNKALVRLTQTTLALRAYWLEHDHQLPPTLDALVPEYLPEMPADPFGRSKIPIRYDAERRLLWSIGSDGIDDGGDDSDTGLDSHKEPTLKLPAWE